MMYPYLQWTIYIYMVGNTSSMLIHNNISILEELSILLLVKVPAIYDILITCPTSIPNINDENITLIIMMKLKWKQVRNSAQYSFFLNNKLRQIWWVLLNNT